MSSPGEKKQTDRQNYQETRQKLLDYRESGEIDRIQGVSSTIHVRHFKGIGEGKIAILCNGESLQSFNIDVWPHPTMGINHSWDYTQSDYHCMIDKRQFEMVTEAKPVFKHLFIGCYGESVYGRWKDFNFESCTEVANWPPKVLGFSTDLARYGAWQPSTPHFAIQLAMYMGYTEMHIWGLDLKGAKHYDSDREMDGTTAMTQDLQFKFAAASIREKWPHIRIYNRNPASDCAAFPKLRPDILVMGIGRSGTTVTARVLHERFGVCFGHYKSDPPRRGDMYTEFRGEIVYEDSGLKKGFRNILRGKSSLQQWITSFGDNHSRCGAKLRGVKQIDFMMGNPKIITRMKPRLIIWADRPLEDCIKSWTNYNKSVGPTKARRYCETRHKRLINILLPALEKAEIPVVRIDYDKRRPDDEIEALIKEAVSAL